MDTQNLPHFSKDLPPKLKDIKTCSSKNGYERVLELMGTVGQTRAKVDFINHYYKFIDMNNFSFMYVSLNQILLTFFKIFCRLLFQLLLEK